MGFLRWFFDDPLAIVGAVGVGVALYQICQSRKLAQQKATLAFLREYNSADRVDNALATMRDKKPWETANAQEQNDIKYLLNLFENLAIGLNHGIYDKQMIRASFGLDLWLFYRIAEPYILAMRAADEQKHLQLPPEYQRAYSEFEVLAKEIGNATG